MSTKGKEYQLAIRIAGTVDKSFGASMDAAKRNLIQYQRQFDKLNNNLKKVDKGFDGILKAGKACLGAIATAAGVASAAVGAMGSAAIHEGSEFESAFAGVKKTVEATAEEYAQLRQTIFDMTKAIPSGAAEIAGVMEIAGQLGIAKESLADFTETMINIGVSTNLSAEEAATNLAKFANVVQMADYGTDGISNWERLGSVIVDLGNNFATAEAEIVEMGTRLASTGSLVGLSEAQIMALATAMSSVGIDAEAGGTAISKLLKNMQLAVELNSGALADYASVANMTGEQFRQTFRDDATVALSAFIEGLNDTERNGRSAIAILDDMKLTEIRLSNTIQALSGAEGVMSDALRTANDAWSENTALAAEAEKRYETAESRVQIMKNAVSELGITAYNELREPFVGTIDLITDKLWALNDYASSAQGIHKWMKNINTELPTMKRYAQNAWKKVSPFFNGLQDFGKWCIKHKDGVIGFIEGVGAALVSYKIASTLTHIVSALPTLLASLSPLTFVIVGAAAALGGLVAAVESYKNHQRSLVDENLANHFGNIALSMEEIQSIAEHIMDSDSLGGVKRALEAFEDLDGFSATMSDTISEIDKMNWKVSIGMELKPDEQESYKETIDQYVEAANNYALQSQYAVSLNLSTVFGSDDPEGQDIASKVNGFYAGCYSEMTDLGKQLSNAVNEAFGDNILDPDEIISISQIQAKMAELQEKMATGEFDAQLSLLRAEYSGGSLDVESFQNLQEELAKQAATAEQVYRESYVKNRSSVDQAYTGGELTEQEHGYAQNEVMEDYLTNAGQVQAKALNFQLETIMDQYADELDPAIESYLGRIQEIIEKYRDWDWENDWKDGHAALMPELYDAANAQELDKTTRAALQELLDAMQPTVEQMNNLKQQYADLGIQMTDGMSESLYNYNLLAVLADNSGEWWATDGISDGIDGAYIIGQEMAKAGVWDSLYDGVISEARKSGYVTLYDTYKEGAIDASVHTAAEGMYAETNQYVQAAMSEGFTAYADVNINLNPLYKWKNDIIPNPRALRSNALLKGLDIKHNANGGIWNKPILTTFAERCPEAAIPIDGSRNAIDLWEKTGRLLGMESKLDNLSLEGGSGPVIEYSPVLKFYGDAPSKDDITQALSISQDEFENLMDRYLKGRGRVSFG